MLWNKKKTKVEEKKTASNSEGSEILKKKTIKELIAPSGIDASSVDHLEIISNVKSLGIYTSLVI